MIEISDKKYWIECTFKEAEMYLKFLEIEGKRDWRFFKDLYEIESYLKGTNLWNNEILTEKDSYLSERMTKRYYCIPVRNND